MIVIDFYTIAFELAYVFWRKPIFLAYMQFIALSFDSLQTKVQAFYAETKFELTHYTGQRIHLRYVLNHYFDPTGQGITIVDGPQLDEFYLFNLIEQNEELYIYNTSETSTPVYVFNEEESSSNVDFEVIVPNGLTVNLAQMHAVIMKYKCEGFTYKITQL